MIDQIIRTARVSINVRKYYTSGQKAAIVSTWEHSGTPIPEFCRQYGLVANFLILNNSTNVSLHHNLYQA